MASYREALLVSRDDPQIGLDGLLSQIPTADARLVVAGWQAGSTLIFGDDDADLGAMDAAKWQRTLDYHARASAVPSDLDPQTMFAAAR